MMVLLVVRFLAELGMLACLAIGGWQLTDSWAVSLVLAVVLPVAAAVVWGRLIAPRAPHRLRDPGRLGVEVVLFAAALLAILPADPSPAMAVLGVVIWLGFLGSTPARRHEVVPSRP